MATNTAVVSGNGVVVRQNPVSPSWLEECQTACQKPGPKQLVGVNRTLTADDIDHTAQVYRKDGLGMTDDITVSLDLPSFCGPGIHWNKRMKRCVADKVPRSLCGQGTTWDTNAGQCVRVDGCAPGFRYTSDVCQPDLATAPGASPSPAFRHTAA